MSAEHVPHSAHRHSGVGVIFWVSASGTAVFGLWITGLVYDTAFVLGFFPVPVMAYVVFAACKASLAQKREARSEGPGQ